jgi:hypothetical protein
VSDAPKAPPVPDGTYDVFIVDAVPHPDRPESVVKVEVTIVSGEFKGEVLNLSANGISGSDIDLMGVPAALTVTDGVPVLTVEP